MLLLLLGCTDPEPRRHREEPPPTDGVPTTATSPDETGETGETGAPEPTPPAPFDCTGPPPAGPFTVDMFPIETTEDFDFDALGSLVYTTATGELVAADGYGGFEIIVPNILDTRGIQVLSDGDVLAAYIGDGKVGHIDRVTGATEAWMTGVRAPNALDIGDGDVVYVTETAGGGPGPRVLRYDPATGVTEPIAEGFVYPTGLALNEAQDRLYVTDYQYGFYVMEKDAAGVWGPPELAFETLGGDAFDGIEVDVCGRVYMLHIGLGLVYRWDPETGARELLVDIDDPGSVSAWSSVRWGSGRGPWQRDVLYVTDRHRVFGVHVGVPGRGQPVDAVQ